MSTDGDEQDTRNTGGKMNKLKLSTRILVYFLFVAIFTQVINNYFLVSSAQKAFLEAAGSKQQAIAAHLSQNVESYLDSSINRLRDIAITQSAPRVQEDEMKRSLAASFAQNTDLERVAVLDNEGREKLAFNREGIVHSVKDVSGSDAFKAVQFLAGKNYISSVNEDEDGELIITMAVPILRTDFDEKMDSLGSANFGSYKQPSDILGAVVADYNVKDLWKTILSTEVGDQGYAYIVDTLGNVVAHPDESLLSTGKKVNDVEAFKQMITGNFETRPTVSETGQQVVSTPKVIPDSGWALIVEEPRDHVYSTATQFIILSIIVGAFTALLDIILSLFFGRRLAEPIKKLVAGAKKIGAGNFGHKIDIQTNDEFQSLADAFNAMSGNTLKLVNDLKSNNQKLTKETAKLDSIISSATDGIIALSRDGAITSINPPAAKLVGKRQEEMIGRGIADEFKWEHSDGRLLELNLGRPGTHEYSEITLRYNKQISFLDIVVTVLDDAKDGGVSSIITIHDLTKSRELEFMKLDFVAIAAHELRTPLTVVRGYLDLLNDDAVKRLSIMSLENIQKTIRATDDLRNLINKLLNIARIERGDMEIFPEKLNLSTQVAENVHHHKSAATQNEQKLMLTTNTENAVYVMADPSSITEVLNNLIGNAIKYTGRGGKIQVSLTVDTEKVRIDIADNGPGIPDELHAKLFTKFYRAERSLIAGTKGTGLGLFISRTIIELQNGEIGIMPSEGQGTRFYFTLPLYKPKEHDKLIHNHQTGGVRGWFKKNTHR